MSEVLADGALLLDRTPGVITLTFNRPERMNAMNPPIYFALAELATELRGNLDVRAVVLKGAGGKAFSAGNEISTFVEMTSGEEGLAYEQGVREVLRAFAELEQVTIAAIDGVCVGGGLGVATYCDIRIATPHSRFGYPIARTLPSPRRSSSAALRSSASRSPARCC
jgi:enoyl-CoA hydratase